MHLSATELTEREKQERERERELMELCWQKHPCAQPSNRAVWFLNIGQSALISRRGAKK